MPERNRVTPTGEIVAIPLRGAWVGNRGVIHAGREIAHFHGGNDRQKPRPIVAGHPPGRS